MGTVEKNSCILSERDCYDFIIIIFILEQHLTTQEDLENDCYISFMICVCFIVVCCSF